MEAGSSRPVDDAVLASLQPRLVGRWVNEADAPRDRVIDGTVVSADISGFTRLAESLVDDGPRLAAEMLIGTINQCFEPMIDEITDQGGDVLKFGGDAMFVLFDGPDHATRAAIAAHRMQASLLRTSTEIELDPPLSMTVGVASGPVRLVLAGIERRELVVDGPTVDLCLQLEADAEPGEVLVAPETAQQLPAGWLDDDDPEVTVLVGPSESTPADETRSRGGADAVPVGPVGPAIEPVDWSAVLSPELASAVAAYEGVGGELRVVTVAFIDLPTAELAPAAVAEAVTRVDQVCRRHGAALLGTDVARGGIKLLLAAGAPTAGDADEDAMLGAAVELVHDPDGPPMRAGINRGLVFVGFLGSPGCRTLTVMGDPTNLAARLLGKAELGAVAVSLPVLEAAGAHYPTTELPPLLVKGRLAPVTVHRLDGPAESTRGPDLGGPLIGRQAELGVLVDAVARVGRGAGSVVELVGEAGLGASRLLNAVVEDLPVGFLQLKVEGRLGGAVPYRAVRPLLRDLAGLDRAVPGAEPDDEAPELQGWVERTAPELAPWVPLMAPAFGVAMAPTDATEAVEPEFRQRRAQQAIVEALSASLTVPTVIVVEDAHRLDPASWRLCQAIGEVCAERPWLLIASTRPGGDVFGTGELVELGPMTVEQCRDLVAATGDLPSERCLAIARQSGGNPGFAVELARAEIEGLRGAGHDLSSIEALVTARIDRLGHDLRVLVRTAAVLGRRFSLPVLRAVLEADRPDGAATFESFVAALPRLQQLIDDEGTAGDGWYGFRAGAVHQVAYGGLSARRRRELHRLVALALEERVGDVGELAWHYEQAGDDLRCWEYSRLAAERDRKLGLMDQAAEHLSRAVTVADRVGPELVADDQLDAVLVELFNTYLAAKRNDEGLEVGQRALDRLDDTIERTRLLVNVCDVKAEVLGSFGEMAERLTDELDRHRQGAEAGGPLDHRAEDRAVLSGSLAFLHYRQDDLDRALAAADQAIADATAAETPAAATGALLIRQAVLADRGLPEQVEAAEELLATATAVGDLRALFAGHNNLGLDHQDAGRWDEARVHYGTAIDYAEQMGDTRRAMTALINRGALLVDQGRWDDARRELDEVRREATYHGSGWHAAWVKRELARLEIHAGRPGDGRPWLEQAAEWYREAELQSMVYEVDLLAMAADLAEGRSQEVLDAAPRLDPPDEVVSRLVGRPALMVGYALLQRAQVEPALEELSRAVAETEGVSPYGLARALTGRSEAERAAGRARSARRTEAEATAILESLGVETLPVIPLPR